LQVTGIFTDLGLDNADRLTFIKTAGPSALAFNGRQLEGHGKEYHSSGFSSPVGKLKDKTTPLEDFNEQDLEESGLVTGKSSQLTFESGIQLEGVVKDILKRGEKILIITFEQCTVKERNGNLLFMPEWGTYDMAVGEKITSVFNGAADKDAYEEIPLISKQQSKHHIYDEKTVALHAIYAKIRSIREDLQSCDELPELFNAVKRNHRQDWLASLEILEILHHKYLFPALRKEIQIYLELKASNEKDHAKLINDGLHVIANPVSQLITLKDEHSAEGD
ncbi:MAG TPA: phenylalanine 4-monooxygenase, partial [Pedobacter sp.]